VQGASSLALDPLVPTTTSAVTRVESELAPFVASGVDAPSVAARVSPARGAGSTSVERVSLSGAWLGCVGVTLPSAVESTELASVGPREEGVMDDAASLSPPDDESVS